MSEMQTIQVENVEKIKAVFDRNPEPTGGKIHMVGLEEIKARLGPRWAMRKQRVMEAAETVLRHHIAPNDLCLPYGELGFVLLFADSDADRAAATCGLVKAELLRRFAGDSALNGLDIATEVVSLGDGSVEGVSLASALKRLTTAADRPAVSTSAGVSLAAATGDAASEASPFETDLEGLYPPSSAEDRARTGQAIIAAGLSIAEVGDTLGYAATMLRLRFDPVCQAQKGLLTVFSCVPSRLALAGRELDGYRVLNEQSETAVTLLDRIVLAHAMRSLVEGARQHRVGLIIVPVSFDTFARPGLRQEYLHLLTRLPADLRRFLVPFIRRLPQGVPESRLVEIVSGLKPNVRAIGARVPFDPTTVRRVRACGILSASFALNPHGDAEGISPDLIEKGAELLTKAGAVPTLTGISCDTHRERAVAAGYHYISGAAVADRVETPFPPRAWDRSIDGRAA